MALNRVDLGIQYFPQFAADRAIANAQIYIGLPNLDPAVLANQIQAYVVQENGTQVAVPQPIRTGAGGVPTYNGSPVEIAVNELQYSLKALSSTGSQIYYKSIVNSSLSPANSTINLENYAALRAYVGVADTVYITGVLATAQPQGIAGVFQYDETDVTSADNGGTIIVGSDGRRWKRVSPDIVTPEMFGAEGDGATNDSAPLTNCIQFASDFGVTVKAKPSANYFITSDVSITRDENSYPLELDFNGATVTNQLCSIVIGGQVTSDYLVLTTTFTTEPLRGDAFLALASVTGVQPGDLVEIYSPALTNGSVATYHYYPITEISGNNVYIDGTVVADVTTAQIAASGQVGTISVKVYRLSAGVTVKNLKGVSSNTTGVSTFSIFPRFEKFFTVENCKFSGKTRFQIGSQYNAYVKVNNTHFEDMGYLTLDGTGNEGSAPSGLSFGYGIVINDTFLTQISNCSAGRGWHMGDSSRGAMHTQYNNCYTGRNSFGISTHEGAWYLYVNDCVFDGSQGLTCGRNAYTFVNDCNFKNLISHGIVYGGECIEIYINNCTFNFKAQSVLSSVFESNQTSPVLPKAGALSTGFPRQFHLTNCKMFRGRCSAGFGGDSSTGVCVVKGNYLKDTNFQALFAMQDTFVENNSADDVAQFMFVIALGTGNPFVSVKNNTHTSGVTTFAGSALVQFTGTTTSRSIVKDNHCNLSNIVRFASNFTLFLMEGNTNFGGRAALGTATVTNVVNNSYFTAFSDGSTTATVSTNNTLLTP